MPKYVVYGGCLESPVEFPQLPQAPANAEPNWTIKEISSAAPIQSPEFLGENRVSPKAMLRLYRHDDGFRLDYEDSGIFDLAREGGTISWTPGADTDPANVREDIVGPVLATAMHMAGRLCLHGSSVVLPEGAISFLAPKHHGKSTIAMAMLEAGAKLLTDDSLPVEPGPPAMACPGVASVRFWEDTRDRFHGDGETMVGSGGKFASTDLAEQSQLHDVQPLRAIYLLAPFLPCDDQPPVFRKRVSGIESALALVTHAKIGALLGKSEAPVMLDRATAISNAVPVFQLGIERNLDSLGVIVQQLFDWTATDLELTAESGRATS